jgi:hypothetical protein
VWTATAITESAWFSTPLAIGLGIALLAVPTALLVPVAPRGDTRLSRLFWIVVLGGCCASAWLGPSGLLSDPDVHGLAFAAGATIGFGGMLLWQRRRARRPSSAPTPGHKPGIGILEYLLAAILLAVFLEGGSVLTAILHGAVSEWFAAGWAAGLAFYATTGVLFALSFAYSQLVARAAVRAMDKALKDDWEVTPNQHYALLVPPYVLAAANLPVPPILAGICVQLANLFVSWRYTDGRPKTPLETLKTLWARRKRRQARVTTREDGPPTTP